MPQKCKAPGCNYFGAESTGLCRHHSGKPAPKATHEKANPAHVKALASAKRAATRRDRAPAPAPAPVAEQPKKRRRGKVMRLDDCNAKLYQEFGDKGAYLEPMLYAGTKMFAVVIPGVRQRALYRTVKEAYAAARAAYGR